MFFFEKKKTILVLAVFSTIRYILTINFCLQSGFNGALKGVQDLLASLPSVIVSDPLYPGTVFMGQSIEGGGGVGGAWQIVAITLNIVKK